MTALFLLFLPSLAVLAALTLLRRAHGSGAATRVLRLVCIDGPAAGAVVCLDQPGGAPLGIGRGVECELQLRDAAVSRQHIWVSPVQDGVCIRDACSANGVWIDNRRVFEERLSEGDQFQIGAHVFALVKAGALAPVPRTHRAVCTSDTDACASRDALADYALAEVFHVGRRFVLRRARNLKEGDAGQVLIKQLAGVEAHVHAFDALALRSRLARHIYQMRGLRHRHCVALLGGDAGGETPFLVEAFAVGEALQRDLRAVWQADRVARLLYETGQGLAFQHAHGVVHGALTPRDIVFDASGAALVVNGGLARVFAGGAAPEAAADVAYRAPELRRSGRVSTAGDVYALGVIGYQLLTGRLPMLPRRGMPRLFSDAPGPLNAIICRALHRDPARRWPDMDAMTAALAQFAAPADAPRAILPRAPARPIRLLVHGAQRLIPVDASPFVLGRTLLNPSDRELSRRHAILSYQDNAWHIEPSPDAVNAVLLNRSVCAAGCSRMINPGDELVLGATAVRVVE